MTGVLLAVWSLLRFVIKKRPTITRHDDERTYFSYVDNKAKEFPDLIHQSSSTEQQIRPTVYLSVIVPAYNEEQRLPKMLDETIEYLEKQAYTYEIIVVDDGSTDRTSSIVNEFAERLGDDKIKLLKLRTNRGKGPCEHTELNESSFIIGCLFFNFLISASV